MTDVPQQNRLPKSTLLWLGAGTLLGAILLWLALRNADLDRVWATLANTSLLWSIPFVLSYGIHFVLKAYRWRILLKPIGDLHTTKLLTPVMLGQAGNLLMPAQAGELVRLWSARKVTATATSSLLASIFLERILDLAVLMVLVGLSALAWLPESPELRLASYIILPIIALGLGVSILMLRYASVLASRLRASKHLSEKARTNIASQIESAAAGLQSLGSSHLLVWVLIATAAMWAMMGLPIYIAFHALGIDVPVYAAYLVLFLMVIGSIVATTPAQVGTVQICFMLGLGAFGVDGSLALASSIWFHFFATLPVLLVAAGLLFVQARHTRNQQQ